MKRLFALIIVVFALAGAGFFDGLDAQAYDEGGGGGGGGTYWVNTGVYCQYPYSSRTWWAYVVNGQYVLWRCAFVQEL